MARSGKSVLAVIGSGCILKGELVGLADGLYVGCEKKAVTKTGKPGEGVGWLGTIKSPVGAGAC